MSRSNGGTDIDFGGPATYRILVQGALSSDWSGRLAGMSIVTVSREQGQPRTTLVGRIRDQTELSGVLDTLYGLHLSILEVKKLDHESRGQERPGDETRASRPNNNKEIQEQWTPKRGLK